MIMRSEGEIIGNCDSGIFLRDSFECEERLAQHQANCLNILKACLMQLANGFFKLIEVLKRGIAACQRLELIIPYELENRLDGTWFLSIIRWASLCELLDPFTNRISSKSRLSFAT